MISPRNCRSRKKKKQRIEKKVPGSASPGPLTYFTKRKHRIPCLIDFFPGKDQALTYKHEIDI